jgi:hypothetical protein
MNNRKTVQSTNSVCPHIYQPSKEELASLLGGIWLGDFSNPLNLPPIKPWQRGDWALGPDDNYVVDPQNIPR